MKKILITGANSYIGTSFDKYMRLYSDDFSVDTLDMLSDDWKAFDFSNYDTVFHVAGIAHSDSGKISAEKEQLYRKVNTDLTITVAKKAKTEGVKQFIFMSSAIVYGNSAALGKKKMINRDTPVAPANAYGDSKVQAEIGLFDIEDESFKVVILRPPMIYGKGSKGNYPLLSKMARKLPLFPKIDNQRSMLYVENLCEFVKLMIENDECGIFWPQNNEYTNTADMVSAIAKVHNKKIRLTKIFNPALAVLRVLTPLVDKAFGSFTYDLEMSNYDKGDYRVASFEESVMRTERSRQ